MKMWKSKGLQLVGALLLWTIIPNTAGAVEYKHCNPGKTAACAHSVDICLDCIFSDAKFNSDCKQCLKKELALQLDTKLTHKKSGFSRASCFDNTLYANGANSSYSTECTLSGYKLIHHDQNDIADVNAAARTAAPIAAQKCSSACAGQ